jgi:hypothetical protein
MSRIIITGMSSKIIETKNEDACNIPILTSRGTMEVNDDLEAVIESPRNCIQEVRQLSLDIRFTRSNFEGPVANGYPNMVKAGTINKDKKMTKWDLPGGSNGSKVRFGYPRVPMIG